MAHLTTDDELRNAMTSSTRLAVIGMKPWGPASSVPAYLRRHGYETIPVNPGHDEVDGLECVPRVMDAGEVDMVVIFRRPEFIDDHATEILLMDPRPRVVWMQLGIRNERAADRLVDAGVDVVQDRCLAIEHPRLLG